MIRPALLALVCAGCANSPALLRHATPEQLHAAPTQSLCLAYQTHQQADALAEIRARSEFSAEDMAAVEAHQIRIGMSAAAARCSWGDAYFKGPGIDEPGLEKWVYWQGHGYIFIKNNTVQSFSN